MAEHTFSQQGVVESIATDCITVRIECNSACSACHAKSMCVSTDKAEKRVEVEPDGREYQIGDKVIVYGQRQIAFKALFWGYLCPLLLVVVSLAILVNSGQSEIVSGCISILLLLPYYLVLFLLRNRFKKKFVFKIKL